ncbi:hypothetical protein [Vibrio sp.]|uniref:hypothetical protein n=1 Tax=Vibrio sp. TaxID=678 RepID=UPI00378CCDA6
MLENEVSLAALSSFSLWSKLETHLQEEGSTQSTLEKSFVAINGAIHDTGWHKVQLGIELIVSGEKAKRLSHKEAQQTLVIPERLCNAIYGRAIELIEMALPHAQLIADTENTLQENYIEGKQALDNKVKQGWPFSFIINDSIIDNHKYSIAISNYLPQEPKSIVAPLASKLRSISLKNASEFQRYLGQLITGVFQDSCHHLLSY